uniref:Integrase_H2C2 domain-containing protein n=1 Tax=Loa loa TaxID=7209 RepID=A0A1I7VWD6_LOALO
MAQSSITQKEIEHWGLRKDQNGIWRCVGRLRRMMPQIEDFPYFIKKGKLAELIVKYYHENSFHASVRYTWTKMRQRYWIPHGRAYIKKILRKICRGCAMWVVTPFEQPDFPPYPTARITATRPFEITAASKEIIELNRIEGETLEWEFITPGAPWQGGIYERMVGVVKRSLKRAIGTKYLNNAELITLIVELEAIINERPLVDIEEIV